MNLQDDIKKHLEQRREWEMELKNKIEDADKKLLDKHALFKKGMVVKVKYSNTSAPWQEIEIKGVEFGVNFNHNFDILYRGVVNSYTTKGTKKKHLRKMTLPHEIAVKCEITIVNDPHIGRPNWMGEADKY